MVWERVGDSSCNRRLDLSSGSVGGVVARQLFDEMPDHQDATTGGVLRITVSHVLYPVTKEVLHQILEVYGVEKMSVFERVNHVEAMVQLRSWQEAKQARDAFHGRCIYEGCCFLDILLVQPTPDSASSTMARCDAEASAIAPEVIVAGARSSPSDNGQDHVDTSIADSEVPVGDNSIKQATPDVTEHEVISGDQDGMDVSTANERCERGAGAAKSGIRVDYSNGEQTTAIAVKLVEQEVAAEEQDARDCLLTNGNAGPCEAAEVFNVQGKEGSKVRFGAVSYNMVLDALGRNGRLDDTLQLFNRMSREHEPPSKIAVNLGSFNVMVDAYCRAERFRDAIEVMGKMGEKRCAPDALSYNSLIDWLGKNKLVGEVEGLYKGWGSTDLSLSWCKDHMNDLVISLAHKVTKLQVLSLRQIKPQLEDNAVEAVANYCHDLRELDLSRSFGLSNRSLYALAHGCLHLTRLNISGCSNFSDAALTYLTSQCKNLKCLNLCGCVRVASDRALQAIACNCGQLQSLNLGWCDSITDKGVTSLASGCPELRAVDLCGCVNPDEYAYVLLVESGFKVHAIPLDGDDDAIEEILDPDFGEAAIGRVAPVDSGLEWIILLRAYGKCSGNLSVQDTYTPTSSDKVQLNCSILVSPSILPGTGHHVQIHTFGFGADHDSAAMHAIAETSSGTFSYIDAEGSIQDGFAQCIGGLLSVVVKETRLGIECVDEGVLLTSIKSGSYASQVAGNERSVSVDIGDLYADESEVAPSNRFEYHAVTEVIKEVEFKEVDGGAASASEKLNALPIFCQQEIQKQSVAWLIGWALILEYTIGGSSVARGISPDLALFFGGQDKFPFFIAQVHLKWLDTPVDPCAAILVMLVTALLCLGIKESSFVEGIITIANVAVMLFVICAGGWLGFQNGWAGYIVPKGYFPNGVSGVFSGSATLFFVYIGFDAVASTAEEVKNPQRDLPWGMGLTLSLCCILYMRISVIIVGLVPYYAMDLDAKVIAAGANPVQITHDIEKIAKELVEELRKVSKKVYAEHIFKYAECSPSCFVLALIYMERYLQQPNLYMMPHSVHRLLFTSVVVAAKFTDDAFFFNNAFYAREEISSCSTPAHDKYLQVLLDPCGVVFICLHLTTAAWGQAAFQGGRNVTDRPAWLWALSIGLWASRQMRVETNYKGDATATE